MQEADIQFLEDSFKKYYFNHFDQIKVPERTSEREFGYQKFNSGMTRHISIKNDKELHLLLIQNVPSDVYCSNAYYTFPNLPMNEKLMQKISIYHVEKVIQYQFVTNVMKCQKILHDV
jgi:DNA primase small subunit